MTTRRQRLPIPLPYALVLPAMLLRAACGKPEPPPTERPPVPQAERPDQQQATQLRDAIRQPIDRAKAVDAQTDL